MVEVLPYPPPVPVRLAVAEVFTLVLDLSLRCDVEGATCSAIIGPVRKYLDVARDNGVPIAFTVSRFEHGTAGDGIASGLARRASEPIYYPDHFDKLADADLLGDIRRSGARGIVVCGSSTNNCVMYTVTSAARLHGLDVYVPVDCVNAATDYQQAYALYQLTHLPGDQTRPVTITHSSMIGFG